MKWSLSLERRANFRCQMAAGVFGETFADGWSHVDETFRPLCASNHHAMVKRASFDTQIITMVSDGRITPSVWTELLRGMKSKFQYCVSFTTFIELLTALAGCDEAHFEANRKRLLVLTDVPGCEFLPMPGEFLRDRLLGLPHIRPEFSPSALQNEWMPIIKTATSKYELSQTGVLMDGVYRGIDLALVKNQSKDGKDVWVRELELAKNGGKRMPPRDTYAEFILHFDLKADTTAENIQKVSAGLDAGYCHLAQVHHASTKSNYRFDNHPQDWIDNQQLMYLAEPDYTLVTLDQPLIAKLAKSTQRLRVREFNEFATNL